MVLASFHTISLFGLRFLNLLSRRRRDLFLFFDFLLYLYHGLLLALFFSKFTLELSSEVIFFSVASLFTFATSKSSWSPVDVRAAQFTIHNVSHSVNFATVSSHCIVCVLTVAELNECIAFGFASFKMAYNLDRLDRAKSFELFVKSVFISFVV